MGQLFRVCVVVFFIFLGCSAADFFPLAVGFEWTYAVETRGVRGTLTVRVEESKEIGNRLYHRMTFRCSSKLGGEVREHFFRKADGSLWILEDPARPEAEFVYFPEGMGPGKSWESREPQSGFCLGGLFKGFLFSSSRGGQVSVSDGTGQTKSYAGCLKVIRTLDPDNKDSLSQYYREIERYYAPEIGLVREVCRYHTIELVDFKKQLK